MKKVKNETVKSIQGKPFRIPETDGDGQAVMVEDKPKMKDAKMVDLLRVLVFNLPLGKITMEDSIHAHRLFEQMDKASEGFIPIEDAEHDWLKKSTENFGPQIFGINACMVKEALDDFERLHEPKSKEIAKAK